MKTLIKWWFDCNPIDGKNYLLMQLSVILVAICTNNFFRITLSLYLESTFFFFEDVLMKRSFKHDAENRKWLKMIELTCTKWKNCKEKIYVNTQKRTFSAIKDNVFLIVEFCFFFVWTKTLKQIIIIIQNNNMLSGDSVKNQSIVPGFLDSSFLFFFAISSVYIRLFG